MIMAKDDKKPRKVLTKKSTNTAKNTTNRPTKNNESDPKDNIAKSKKLVEKIQRRKSSINASRSIVRSKDDSRICSNGKPMPPLSELERMYEDSDDDNQSKCVSTQTNKLPTNSSQKISMDNITSPKTIKKIADKMTVLITNFPDPTVIENDASPSPPKKRKKTDFIDCPRSPKKSSIISCNSDDIDKIDSKEENECSNKKNNKSKTSKPRFKTNTDDIVAWLQDCEKGNNSDDSNKTVDYDCTKALPISNIGRPQPFSPLPSTSKDRETINKNDQLFNESLISETGMSNKQSKIDILNENDMDSDVEIKPNEVKKENDKLESFINITNTSNTDEIEIIQTPCETIVIDDDSMTTRPITRKFSNKSDIIECIDIVEPLIKKESTKKTGYSEAIVIDDEDGYKFTNDSPTDDEGTEVIDIDNIIAENKAIIQKYSKKSDMDINTVTCVDTSTTSNLNTADTAEPSTSSEIHNTTNKKRKHNIVSKHGESANTQKHNNNNIQDIVTNYFSNNSGNHNQHQETVPRNAIGTSLWNKVNEWLDNLTPRYASNKRRTSRNRTQNVDPSNDSVIEIDDVPSPALNIPSRSPDAPTPTQSPACTNSSDEQIMRMNGVVQNNGAPNPINLDSEMEYMNVYCSGNDVFITGSEDPPAGFDSSHIIHKRVPIKKLFKQQEALAKLLSKMKSLASSKNLGDCPICMDSLVNKSVASTICGHVFCMKCIEAAFRASGKRCPTCRKVLKKGGYHQLFL